MAITRKRRIFLRKHTHHLVDRYSDVTDSASPLRRCHGNRLCSGPVSLVCRLSCFIQSVDHDSLFVSLISNPLHGPTPVHIFWRLAEEKPALTRDTLVGLSPRPLVRDVTRGATQCYRERYYYTLLLKIQYNTRFENRNVLQITMT